MGAAVLPYPSLCRVQRLQTVSQRLAKLHSLASDQTFTRALSEQGRDLRLSAAIAWASEAVDAARAHLTRPALTRLVA